jgi:hypothetical protein
LALACLTWAASRADVSAQLAENAGSAAAADGPTAASAGAATGAPATRPALIAAIGAIPTLPIRSLSLQLEDIRIRTPTSATAESSGRRFADRVGGVSASTLLSWSDPAQSAAAHVVLLRALSDPVELEALQTRLRAEPAENALEARTISEQIATLADEARDAHAQPELARDAHELEALIRLLYKSDEHPDAALAHLFDGRAAHPFEDVFRKPFSERGIGNEHWSLQESRPNADGFASHFSGPLGIYSLKVSDNRLELRVGNRTRSFVGEFEGLVGGFSDPAGRLYIIDKQGRRARAFDSKLRLLSELRGSPPFRSLTAGFADRSGRLYLIDAGRKDVRVYGADFAALATLDQEQARTPLNAFAPFSGFSDSSGDIYIVSRLTHLVQQFAVVETGTGADRTVRFNPVDTIGRPDRRGWDTAHLNMPTGGFADSEGRIFVHDAGNKRIQVLNPDQEPLATAVSLNGTAHAILPGKVGQIFSAGPQGLHVYEEKPRIDLAAHALSVVEGRMTTEDLEQLKKIMMALAEPMLRTKPLIAGLIRRDLERVLSRKDPAAAIAAIAQKFLSGRKFMTYARSLASREIRAAIPANTPKESSPLGADELAKPIPGSVLVPAILDHLYSRKEIADLVRNKSIFPLYDLNDKNGENVWRAEPALRQSFEAAGMPTADMFLIPVRDPSLPERLDDLHNRSIHTTGLKRNAAFKGVGAVRGRTTKNGLRIAFRNRAAEELDYPNTQTFHGGLLKGHTAYSANVAIDFRAEYRRARREGDPALLLAAKFGGDSDIFLKPAGEFRPLALPARVVDSAESREFLARHQQNYPGIVLPKNVALVDQRAALVDLGGFDEDTAKKKLVFAYTTPVATRKNEIQADARKWSPYFRQLGLEFDPDRIDVGAATRLLVKSAARYAVYSHIVHRRLDMVSDFDVSWKPHDVIFHERETNANPLTTFDYDSAHAVTTDERNSEDPNPTSTERNEILDDHLLKYAAMLGVEASIPSLVFRLTTELGDLFWEIRRGRSPGTGESSKTKAQ